MSSKIKVDTIENVAGSGNVSLGSGHNLVVPGDLTVDTSTLKVDATNNRVGIGTASPSDTESLLDLGAGENTGFKRKLLITNTGNSRAGFGAESFKLNMFIADDQNIHIQKLTRDGNFTATQIGMFKNTGGLCFGTDTADANALDDYEEGTWTPTFVSTSASFSYSVQGGNYTKVGRLVFANFRIQLSGAPSGSTGSVVFVGGLPFVIGTQVGTYHGGHPGHYFGFNLYIQLDGGGNSFTTNAVTITGLPFTANSSAYNNFRYYVHGRYLNVDGSNYYYVTANLANGSAGLSLNQAGDNVPNKALPATYLSSSSGQLFINGHYFVS